VKGLESNRLPAIRTEEGGNKRKKSKREGSVGGKQKNKGEGKTKTLLVLRLLKQGKEETGLWRLGRCFLRWRKGKKRLLRWGGGGGGLGGGRETAEQPKRFYKWTGDGGGCWGGSMLTGINGEPTKQRRRKRKRQHSPIDRQAQQTSQADNFSASSNKREKGKYSNSLNTLREERKEPSC